MEHKTYVLYPFQLALKTYSLKHYLNYGVSIKESSTE